MRNFSVSLPECLIEDMKKLVEDEGLYRSRSELVRVAVREYLTKHHHHIHEVSHSSQKTIGAKIISEKVGATESIKIPVGPAETATSVQYKTFKIIDKGERQ